jgi:hypothetical protein
MIQVSSVSNNIRIPMFNSELISDTVHLIDDIIFNPILNFNYFFGNNLTYSVIPSLNDPLMDLSKREFISNWGHTEYLNLQGIYQYTNYSNQIVNRNLISNFQKIYKSKLVPDKSIKQIQNNIVKIVKKNTKSKEEIFRKEKEIPKRKIDIIISQFLENGKRLNKKGRK